MKITRIYFENIRNHVSTEIKTDGRLNVFYGLNGSGKTSVLESISICSFSKSFQSVPDSSVVRFGENYYLVDLKATNDFDLEYRASVKYPLTGRKQISSTFGTNLSTRDIIGELPLVILSPDLKAITSGSPKERREFIDRLLSQSSRTYFENLLNYSKILKQRNNILARKKNGDTVDMTLLETYTSLLIGLGTELIFLKNKFILEFIPYFNSTYEFVSDNREFAGLTYLPHGFNGESLSENIGKDEIEDCLTKKYQEYKTIEFIRGVTLFGPQKDELLLTLNNSPARETASQGQHKSLLIALKFAEFNYLKNVRNETPVVLFDDIFAELDNNRIKKVFELLNDGSAQTFVTITDYELLKNLIGHDDLSLFYVENGIVSRET